MIETKNIHRYFQNFTKHCYKPYPLPFNLMEPNFTGGNISDYELFLIIQTCRNMAPMKILELGTFNGRTTLNLAANTPPEAKVITVDLPNKNESKYKLECENGLDETGYCGFQNKIYLKMAYEQYRKKIRQFWIDSADFPYDNFPEKFDLIFIDASHSYENTLNDSINCFKAVAPNGLIIWHDYRNEHGGGWPGVTKALDELSEITKSMIHIKHTSFVFYCDYQKEN